MPIRDAVDQTVAQDRHSFGRVARGSLRGPAGYTTIELLVALLIFVILARTSAPIFSRLMQSYNLSGAAMEVFAQMQRARMAAVAKGTRYSVKLNDGGKLIVRRYDVPTATWITDTSVPPLPSSSPNVVVAASAEVVFASNGTATQAGTVTLTNPAGKQRQIVVGLGGSIRSR
jgi:Tfp pilus assembly protein FimT